MLKLDLHCDLPNFRNVSNTSGQWRVCYQRGLPRLVFSQKVFEFFGICATIRTAHIERFSVSRIRE